MIRLAEVRRFAARQRIDIAVAVQEVILTILLRRVALSPVGDRLAFKGGTGLRKIVFGAAGRFSEDLDFACLDPESEIAQGVGLDGLTSWTRENSTGIDFDRWFPPTSDSNYRPVVVGTSPDANLLVNPPLMPIGVPSARQQAAPWSRPVSGSRSTPFMPPATRGTTLTA